MSEVIQTFEAGNRGFTYLTVNGRRLCLTVDSMIDRCEFTVCVWVPELWDWRAVVSGGATEAKLAPPVDPNGTDGVFAQAVLTAIQIIDGD
jgi:hypothetical protein